MEPSKETLKDSNEKEEPMNVTPTNQEAPGSIKLSGRQKSGVEEPKGRRVNVKYESRFTQIEKAREALIKVPGNGFAALTPSTKEFVGPLIGCLGVIKAAQVFLDQLGSVQAEGSYPLFGLKGAFKVNHHERQIFMERYVERRHQLLSHINADLIEVISDFAGVDQIDRILFPDRH